MLDISVIMPTARNNYCIRKQPKLHFLKPTMESLSKQRFKGFELILVDGLHSTREYDFSKLPFEVNHVPVHPNHSFWFDRKRWAVCGALNTALLYAEGELVVRIDDCSEFDEDYLERFWEGYQSGYWPLAMHTRYLGGKQAYYNQKYKEEGYDFIREEPDRKEVLEKVYKEGDPIRDTRWTIVEKSGGKMIAPVNWMYGYSSFTLEAALKVNGFDELFDADKSLEDVDFGSRLQMAGYRNMFLLDVNHSVIEHEHSAIQLPEVELIKCNYAIYLLNRQKNRWKANVDILTEEDLEFIRLESLKPPCSPKPNFYADDCQGDLFKLWASNQPKFDLRVERLDMGGETKNMSAKEVPCGFERKLKDYEISTFIKAPIKVGLDEGVGDSRIFRDLEYAFCLQHIKENCKVLDIGASNPWFLLELMSRGCDVTTIDIAEKALSRHKELGINHRVANLVDIPFKDNSFSIILCISTIEHVFDDEDIQGMREFFRLAPHLIMILPFGKADNWVNRNKNKDRIYDESLFNERILPGWTVKRRTQIAVWDFNIKDWVSENCFHLIRKLI